MLAANPHGGPRREDLAPGLRFYPVGNYLIFYRPGDDGIILVRVLHGARDYLTRNF
jgi:toxin ParE1/3/4